MKLRENSAAFWAQGGPRLEMCGNRQILVEGCGGVLEYTQEAVRLRYGRLVLRFTGRGLCLHALSARSLTISGWITGMEVG